MMASNELLYHATRESNRIEQEPVKGQSFDNHWRATLLCRTAGQEQTLLHPRAYHQLLFEGIPTNWGVEGVRDSKVTSAGEYRLVEVYIDTPSGRNFFAKAADVPTFMATWWQEWCALPESIFDLSDEEIRWNFHAWFEAIHPFPDGNGRVGRLLWWNMTMIVDQDIEVVTYNERQQYYDRLEHWRRNYCNVESMNPFR